MSGYVFAETDKLEQIGDALRTTSGSTQTYSVSQLSETAAAAISSGNVVTYPLPIANSTELGGVMPVAKTDEMTEPVGVDSEGKLYTSIPTISLNNITGTLSIAKGGTGATDAEGARAALGITPTNIGAAPSSHSHASSDITSGTLTITQGGTGATDAATARTNLEITPANIGAVNKTGDTLTGSLNATRLAVLGSNNYPTLGFKRKDDTEESALIQINANGQISFFSYHNEMDSASTRYWEGYSLPAASSGLTKNTNYTILTSKSPVTIAQGGTGAITAESACTALGAVKKSGDTMTGDLSFSRASYSTILFTDSSGVKKSAICAGLQSSDLKFRLRLYDTTNPTYYDNYYLPAPPSGLTANKSYNIHTTKTLKYAQGTSSVSGSSETTINYSSAGFTSVPQVFINYSTTEASWTGDNGAIKIYSKTTTSAKAIVGGNFNTVRAVDWFAIGT